MLDVMVTGTRPPGLVLTSVSCRPLVGEVDVLARTEPHLRAARRTRRVGVGLRGDLDGHVLLAEIDGGAGDHDRPGAVTDEREVAHGELAHVGGDAVGRDVGGVGLDGRVDLATGRHDGEGDTGEHRRHPAGGRATRGGQGGVSTLHGRQPTGARPVGPVHPPSWLGGAAEPTPAAAPTRCRQVAGRLPAGPRQAPDRLPTDVSGALNGPRETPAKHAERRSVKTSVIASRASTVALTCTDAGS